jgi:hypothetical protein
VDTAADYGARNGCLIMSGAGRRSDWFFHISARQRLAQH